MVWAIIQGVDNFDNECFLATSPYPRMREGYGKK
jgi:hypothetical protein